MSDEQQSVRELAAEAHDLLAELQGIARALQTTNAIRGQQITSCTISLGMKVNALAKLRGEQGVRLPKVTRPYPRTAPCAVNCRGDGDKVSALIGSNPQEGVAGYGDDLPSALRDLADELEREVGQAPI